MIEFLTKPRTEVNIEKSVLSQYNICVEVQSLAPVRSTNRMGVFSPTALIQVILEVDI